MQLGWENQLHVNIACPGMRGAQTWWENDEKLDCNNTESRSLYTHASVYTSTLEFYTYLLHTYLLPFCSHLARVQYMCYKVIRGGINLSIRSGGSRPVKATQTPGTTSTVFKEAEDKLTTTSSEPAVCVWCKASNLQYAHITLRYMGLFACLQEYYTLLAQIQKLKAYLVQCINYNFELSDTLDGCV